ncbi:MAG: DUF6078 family protein [Bacteroides sp.]
MILQQDIPHDYVYCFAGKGKCQKADSCLRAIAARLLAESKDPQPQTVNQVNVLFLEQLPADYSPCPLYRSCEPARYAKGMTRLFDELPLKLAATVRKRVIRCFSCERYFYHSRKGDRLIPLDEQRKIANVFRSTGLGITPVYDGYEYVTEW